MLTTVAVLAALAAVPPQDSPQQAQNPLEQAVEALGREDYTAAATFLEQAVEKDGEHVEARFNLAFAYARLGRDDDAIRQYEAVLALKPDLPQARMNLGVLLLQNKRPADAAPHLEALTKLRPADADARFYLAHALMAAERFALAVPAYEEAIALDPGRAEAHLGLGRALARLGRLDAAEPSYRRAGELNSELDSMLLELAEAQERAGAVERALALYRAYSKSHADDVAVLERIGLLTLDAGGGEEAVRALEGAVRRSPTSANKAALAEAYARSSQPEKALVLWGESIQGDPGAVGVRMRYANALLQAMRFQEAGGQYLAVTRIEPARAAAWNGLAFCLYKADNHPAALEALQESARREPPAPGNLYLRAIVEDKLQLFEQAKQSYEAFLAAQPDLEDEVWKSEQRLKALDKILSKR